MSDHKHTVYWTDEGETDGCGICGEPRPKPCSYGEQCSTFQKEWFKWGIELVEELPEEVSPA